MPRLITAAGIALLLAAAFGMLPGCGKPKDEPPGTVSVTTTRDQPAPSVAAAPTTKPSAPAKPPEPAPEVRSLPKEEDAEVAAYFKAKGWRVGEDFGFGDQGVSSLQFGKRDNPGEFVLTPDDIKMLQRAKKVQVIDTYELALTDVLVAQLLKVPNLIGIVLGQEKVTDATVKLLAGANELEVIKFNHLSNVTDAGLKELAKLPKLRMLYLQTFHGISGKCFKSFAGSKSLRSFELLQGFDLTDEGISWLAKLPNLNYLHVSAGKNGKITAAGIRKVVEGRLPYEFKFPSDMIDDALLEALVARGWLYGPKPEGVRSGVKPATSDEVRDVSLNGCPVTDRGVAALISKCPNIAQVFLANTGVTDATLKSLAGQRKLTFLRVDGTKINGSGLAALAGLPITGLDASKCDLTEEAFVSIGKMPELTRLSIQAAKFKPTWLKHIATAPKLKYLDLLRTDADDDAAKSLASLPAVEELVMFGTPLGDKGFTELVKAPTLRSLVVSGTKVTKEAYEKAKASHPMLRLRHKDFD